MWKQDDITDYIAKNFLWVKLVKFRKDPKAAQMV